MLQWGVDRCTEDSPRRSNSVCLWGGRDKKIWHICECLVKNTVLQEYRRLILNLLMPHLWQPSGLLRFSSWSLKKMSPPQCSPMTTALMTFSHMWVGMCACRTVCEWACTHFHVCTGEQGDCRPATSSAENIAWITAPMTELSPFHKYNQFTTLSQGPSDLAHCPCSAFPTD